MQPDTHAVAIKGPAAYRRQNWINASAAALGGLLLGYDTSVISGAILFVRSQFHLDSFGTEIAVSIVLVGALFGAMVGGYMGDRLGRKPSQIINAIVFTVFAAVTSFATTVPVFLAGRFMVGVAVGVTSMITPLYIAEISPPSIRGALVQLNQLMITVGIAAAYVVAWFFSSTGNWRAMFLSAAIPSLVLLVSVLILPESPRWLASRGHKDAARIILNSIYGPDEAEVAMRQFETVIETDKVSFRDLFHARFRMPLIAGIGLAVFQQITGINTIIYYTPIIMQMAGFHTASSAILATLPIGLLNVLVGIAVIPLLDRLGRRKLLLISIAGMFFCLLVLSYSMGQAHISRYLVVGAFLAYLAAFEIGLGPVFWLLISEIYPTNIRGKAMSLASITIWAADIAVALTFLTLIDDFGARISFLLYAGACVAAFVFSYYVVPETKGKTLEEIEAGWK